MVTLVSVAVSNIIQSDPALLYKKTACRSLMKTMLPEP
jgi:hypothetical protein